MALVPLPEHPAGLLGRYAARFSSKQFDGLVVDAVKAASHHTGVLMSHGAEEKNQRSRFNAALGLTSQGFGDRCELPAPAASGESTSV